MFDMRSVFHRAKTFSTILYSTATLAFSMLSDSGEDAKVKGMQKVGGAKNRKRKAHFLPSFLPFYFRAFLRALSIQRAQLSRSLEHATATFLLSQVYYLYGF